MVRSANSVQRRIQQAANIGRNSALSNFFTVLMQDSCMNIDRKTNTEHEIKILSDIPGARAASVFLIFFGMVLAILPQFARNRDEIGLLGLMLLFLLGSAIVYGGVILANKCKRRDIYLSLLDDRIKIVHKGWFSSKLETESFYIKDIKDLQIEQANDSDGDPVYQLVLKVGSRKISLMKNSYSRPFLVEEKYRFDEAIKTRGESIKHALKTGKLKPGLKAVPAWFWITIAFVCLCPLAAHLLGKAAGFSSFEIISGAADKSGCQILMPMLEPILRPQEKLLWLGQPEAGREASVKMWFFIPFAIVWTLFSLLWTGLAAYAAKENKSPGAAFLVLFGLPFVLLGFGMLSTPYFSQQQELNTVYILTNEGALRIVNKKAIRLCDYKSRDFGPVEITRYKPGRADILFIKDASEGEKYPYGGFYGIKDADNALEILQKAETHYRSQKSK